MVVVAKKITLQKMMRLSKPSVVSEWAGIKADAIEEPAKLPGTLIR